MRRRSIFRKPKQCRSSEKSFQRRFETLESRTLLAVFNLTPAAGDAGLRAAILAADTNGDPSNTINLAAGKYLLTDTSAGDLVINSGASPLTIAGAKESTTIIEPSPTVSWKTRIFDIEGSGTVTFKNLTIEGGNLQAAPGNNPVTAQGGGLLVDGGQVKLSNVAVVKNVAHGATGIGGGGGAAGGSGQQPGPGGGGQKGFDAQGGGIFLAGGTLDLLSSQVTGNQAIGGAGGAGGKGAQVRRAPRVPPARLAATAPMASIPAAMEEMAHRARKGAKGTPD